MLPEREGLSTVKSLAVSISSDAFARHFRLLVREPGGVLFEIATDPSGFTADLPESKWQQKELLDESEVLYVRKELDGETTGKGCSRACRRWTGTLQAC